MAKKRYAYVGICGRVDDFGYHKVSTYLAADFEKM